MCRVAVRRAAAVTALVIGALLVVSAGLGGTATGGLGAKKTAVAPLSVAATQLKIGLRVTPPTATRGQTVTYVLRVSNVGSTTASLVRVCTQVPLRLTLVSAPRGFVSGSRRSLCRRFPRLPVGGTLVFNFRMRVSPSAPGGVVINTGYARASGMESFIYAQVPLTIGVLGKCGPRSAC
jgi:uncharacterized repeat protein (TIGR01451 family)